MNRVVYFIRLLTLLTFLTNSPAFTNDKVPWDKSVSNRNPKNYYKVHDVGIASSCTNPNIIEVRGESVLDTLLIDVRDGNDFFTFTVPNNGHMTLSSCRADFSFSDKIMRIYIDDCDNLLSEEIGNVRCVNGIDYSIPVFAGDTFIMEWGLNPDKPAASQIDSVYDVIFYYRKEIMGTTCEAAHNLSCQGEFELDIRGVEQWYTWTAPNSGEYTIGASSDESAAYNFGIPIQVLQGSNCAASVLIADNDTDDLDFVPSVSFMAMAGETYFFVFKDQPNPSANGPISAELTEVAMPAVNRSFHQSVNLMRCDDYFFDGDLLTESGMYHGTFASVTGCDSLVTLELSILQPSSGEETVEACENYDWNGNNYTSSGTYQALLTTVEGCDSIAMLHLTILAPTISTDTVTSCGSYEWNGTIYATSGNYMGDFVNEVGCDSTAMLSLTILPEPLAEVEVNRTNLEVKEVSGATYQWYDCATNTALVGEDGRRLNSPGSGEYYVEVTANGCASISSCVAYNLITSLKVENKTGISLYPTETTNEFSIDVNQELQNVKVQILAMNGRVISSYTYKNYVGASYSLASQTKGIYLVQLIVAGQLRESFRVIKR